MPIPDLSNKPGPGRPGWGPIGSYDFQFRVEGTEAVVIKANAAAGGSFTVQWPNGTTQVLSGNNASITAPDATDGIVSINNENDTDYCDDFAVVGGKDVVREVISWGRNAWSSMASAFDSCANLTSISETVFTAAAGCNMRSMLNNCDSLTIAKIKNWNLSAGIDAYEGLIRNCDNLEELDATGLIIKFSSASGGRTMFGNNGNSVANGCLFKMSGMDFSSTTVNLTGSNSTINMFSSCKFADGSDLSNWNFPATWNGTGFFNSSKLVGTNAVLNISNWDNYPGTSLTFGSMNDSMGDTGAKINLTNLNLSNFNNISQMFYFTDLSQIIGVSTWNATAGNVNAYRAFWGSNFLSVTPTDNFSNAFIQSLTPTNVQQMFASFGNDNENVAVNLNGLDLSNITNFSQFMSGAKFSTAPDFSNVTFPSTAISWYQAFYSFDLPDAATSIIDFSTVTAKISNLQATFSGAGVNGIKFGNNIDFSQLTSFDNTFYSPSRFLDPQFPTNANFGAVTTFYRMFYGNGNSRFSTCQTDNFIRRLYATAFSNNGNVPLNNSQITEAPSVVRTLEAELVANGWTITENSTDAALPFAYASYAVDPTGITTISPTVTPPAGSVFTATNSLNINENTGVITIGSFRGGSTIRCTYPDGCYNEVVMLIQVPFVMRTVIPGLVGSTTYLDMQIKPQTSDGECFVDWGDSNSETLTGNTTHTYASAGTYDIKIFDSPSGSKFENFSGYFPVYTGLNGATYGSTYDIDIIQWGEIQWKNPSTSGQGWFALNQNQKSYIELAAASNDAPDLSQVTSLRKMFGTSGGGAGQSDIARFTDPNDSMRSWDTSTITDMSEMWQAKLTDSSISLDLSQWDVSNVETFASMFDSGASNQQSSIGDLDISGWNSQRATNMSRMFYRTSANSVTGLGDLNTSLVTTMSNMFNNASGGVVNQASETLATKMVNGVLRWDVNNVTSFSSMFFDANGLSDTTFPTNWNISSDASKTVNMSSMFGGTPTGLTSVTDLDAFATKTINETWYGGTSYTAWNMSRVSSLSLFAYAAGGGPTSRNYNIASWQISSALTSMYYMFGGKTGGNGSVWQQDVGHWDVSGLDDGPNKISYWLSARNGQNPPNMATSIYDSILDVTDGWGSQTGITGFPTNITWENGNSQYSPGNLYYGSQAPTTYQNNKIYNGNIDLRIYVSVGDVVERDPDPNGVFDTYAIITGFVAGDPRYATTQGNIGPADYKVMDSDAAKGRVALINAGWNINDGGAYIPFDSIEMTINVNAGDTFSITPQGGPNNFKVDWGDGNGFVGDPNNGGANYTGSNFTATSPAYTSAGNKTVKICEDSSQYIHSLSQNYNGPSASHRQKIININHWGTNPWRSLYRTFYDCDNLVLNTTTTPNLSNGPTLNGMFLRSAGDFTNSNIANWAMSTINDVGGMFGETNMNVDISGWDTSQFINMAGFLNGNSTFNQDISNWNTSNVTSMETIFRNCSSLNADLNTKDAGTYLAWDVSNVTNFRFALSGTTSMTYDIDKWQLTTDPTKSISMISMFTGNINWMTMEPKTVTVGSGAYQKTYLAWDTQRVTNMQEMFSGNAIFNKDIGKWDTSNVTNMYRFQRNAFAFNNGGQPMNTRTVTVGTGATARTYTAWDVSSVTVFERGPFENNQAFNQDVSNWDVSNAANALVRGFEGALVFDHYLPWDLNTSANPPSTYYLYNMFNNSGMSTNNYTDTIVYWANFVKNQTPDAPLNVNMNTQGGRTYDTTRSGGSNFANAGRARSFLTLDISVSGLSGFNGTYYYDYATGQYINESDSTLKFVYNTDESVWELQDEEGAQHSGSGGSQSGGPTSATWSGFTVSDASKGWTIVSDTITN